jgi:hypothetical protein
MKRYIVLAALALIACEKAGSSETRQIAEKIGMGFINMKWDDVTAHAADNQIVAKLNGLRMQIDNETNGNAKHIEFVEFSESASGENTIVKIHQRILMRGGFHNSDGVTSRVKYEMTMAKKDGKWMISALSTEYLKEPK